MATLTVSGNNASYTLFLSGMSTSTRYHVFIADLSSSGAVTGYKCVRSSLGSSSTWTYDGSSSSPYSNYGRSVYVYTSTAATSHSVGTIYTYDEMRSGCTFMDSNTIPASGGGSYNSNFIYFRTGTGVSSYTMQYANSTSTTNTDSITGRNTSTTLPVRENTNATLIRLTYEDGYGGPFYFVEYTSSSFSSVKKTFEDGDPDVYSSGTRYIKLFATESTTTAYIKLGAGVSSAMIYVDGVAKSDVRDKAYHAITVNSNARVEVRSIGLTSGYQKPYIFRFYRSSGATTPSSTSASQNTDTPYYTYTSDRVYAEIVATKKMIDPFYWQSAAWDAANIKTGQPISNLTAVRWNSLLAKIKELAEAEGGSYSYSGVSSGGTIYATTFNAARAAISNRSGYGTLPAAQSKGNSVKAALFEGSGSLKSALNAAISYHNNS